MMVASVDKPLLPCDPKFGKDRHILGQVSFDLELSMIDLFCAYQQKFSDEIGQSSSST
jgi:hypothetical protein